MRHDKVPGRFGQGSAVSRTARGRPRLPPLKTMTRSSRSDAAVSVPAGYARWPHPSSLDLRERSWSSSRRSSTQATATSTNTPSRPARSSMPRSRPWCGARIRLRATASRLHLLDRSLTGPRSAAGTPNTQPRDVARLADRFAAAGPHRPPSTASPTSYVVGARRGPALRDLAPGLVGGRHVGSSRSVTSGDGRRVQRSAARGRRRREPADTLSTSPPQVGRSEPTRSGFATRGSGRARSSCSTNSTIGRRAKRGRAVVDLPNGPVRRDLDWAPRARRSVTGRRAGCLRLRVRHVAGGQSDERMLVSASSSVVSLTASIVSHLECDELFCRATGKPYPRTHRLRARQRPARSR